MAETGDWKTPLGYYEKAIADFNKLRADLYLEIQQCQAARQSLEQLQDLQVELEALKSGLKQSQSKPPDPKQIAEAIQIQTTQANAHWEGEVQALKAELQATREELKQLMSMEDRTNSMMSTEFLELKQQLSLIQTQLKESSTDQNSSEFQLNVTKALSKLQTQITHLSDEILFVSPITGTDYQVLHKLLIKKEWKKADEQTKQLMIQISKRQKDSWLDRGDIERFPWQDLRIINRLWAQYSNGRFGFTAQQQIWQTISPSSNNDFEAEKSLADQVGWRVNNSWRSVDQLIFSEEAPEGHLPSTAHLLNPSWGKVEDRIRIFFSNLSLTQPMLKKHINNRNRRKDHRSRNKL